MTSRRRFRETMALGQPDRLPLLEEGLRDDVRQRWSEQGLALDADLNAVFQYDRRERIELDLSPRPPLTVPAFAMDDPSALRQHLDAADPARLPKDWPQRVRQWNDRDHILELPIHSGLFLTLGIHDWAGLEQAMYLLADRPAAARQIMDAYAALAAAMADRVLSEVQVDMVSFSEPIGSTHGALVSPAMYRDIALASYRPILDVLRQRGVQTIAFITYANARRLLDDVLDAGFNCLWAMEVESPEMDYVAIRRRFGKELRLIGGIDLDVLTRGDDAIEREIMTKAPLLLAEGGYIPLADWRVRPSIPWRGYECYRRVLRRVVERFAAT